MTMYKLRMKCPTWGTPSLTFDLQTFHLHSYVGFFGLGLVTRFRVRNQDEHLCVVCQTLWGGGGREVKFHSSGQEMKCCSKTRNFVLRAGEHMPLKMMNDDVEVEVSFPISVPENSIKSS